MKSRRIVIVDDEPDLRKILCDILEEEGYDVRCLDHPALAMTLDESDVPSLFVLDIMLPGMSGIELARKLRERGFTETPIVGISASTRMLQAARESHLFQDTIAKPFELGYLLDTVERYAS